MKPQKLSAIFCDFDGTITTKDVGYHLFRHFSGGRNDALLPDWKSGRMSTRECLRREAAMVQANKVQIHSFLDQFEIDEFFPEFVHLCERYKVKLEVLSDGLQFYIERILSRYRLSHLPISANRGIVRDGGIVIEFPRENESCVRCGSCKGEYIRRFKNQISDASVVAFVGDGYSDLCALKETDLVFAKKDLAQYCQKREIAYFAYETFQDVIQTLQTLGHLQSDK